MHPQQKAQPLPDDSVHLCTVRQGTTIGQLPDGRLIAAHPDEKPMLITLDGLVPLEPEWVDASDPSKVTISIGKASLS